MCGKIQDLQAREYLVKGLYATRHPPQYYNCIRQGGSEKTASKYRTIGQVISVALQEYVSVHADIYTDGRKIAAARAELGRATTTEVPS